MRLSLWQAKFLFERKLPTSIKPEATPGEQIDLRISGEPEELYTQHDREDIAFLTFSLKKQILNSPQKSTIIADSIKNYAREKNEKVENYLVSHQDSEIHAEQNGSLERHEASKIEDRVSCPKCLGHSEQSETCVG